MPETPTPSQIGDERAHIRDDRRSEVIASSVICITIAIVAVGLRLFARRLSKAKVGADDYMTIVALVMCMGQVTLVFYSVYLGAGRHVFLLKDPSAFAKTIISEEVLYCVSTSSFKLSALLLFHRIFGSAPRFTLALCFVAFVILANNIAGIFLSIFQCNPVHKAWEQNTTGTCVNILLAACIPGAINVASDVMVIILPMPLIWEMQMQLSKKIQLVFILLLGTFVCIASICRTIIIKRLSPSDATWAEVDPSMWAVVENAIGILCTSLCTMRPIYVLLASGHFCTSAEGRYCERCTAKTKGSTSGHGGSSSAEKRDRISNSNVESIERGGVVITFKMC